MKVRVCIYLIPIGQTRTKVADLLTETKELCRRESLDLFAKQESDAALLIASLPSNMPEDIGIAHIREWLSAHLRVDAWTFTVRAVRCERDSTDNPPENRWIHVAENGQVRIGIADEDARPPDSM